MDLTLRVWRQKDAQSTGTLETYQISGIIPDMSFLEMLDVTNERLIEGGQRTHCLRSRLPRGHLRRVLARHQRKSARGFSGTTTCQLHMRKFNDGDTITVEPWRASAFPVLKDLVVDRTSFDRIIQAGGFISANTGGAPDGNAVPIPKPDADAAMDAAACIGCGACAASCPNGSAMLFVAAKVSHLAHLPQGVPERGQRVLSMVARMDEEGFGNCTNHAECEAMCPKDISISHIAKMNREFIRATVRGE